MNMRIIKTIGVSFILVFSAFLLFIINDYLQRKSNQIRCDSKILEIYRSMKYFKDKYGYFPPPIVFDDVGRPLQSWRTAILPFSDYYPGKPLYNNRLPWNSKANLNYIYSTSKYRSSILYNCNNNNNSTNTNYLMYYTPSKENDRFFIIEVVNLNVNWAEPYDLCVSESEFTPEKAMAFANSNDPDGPAILSSDGRIIRRSAFGRGFKP